jgi:hypothetical protein
MPDDNGYPLAFDIPHDFRIAQLKSVFDKRVAVWLKIFRLAIKMD